MENKVYTMRIVEGALTNPGALDQFSPKKLEYFDEKWKHLLEVNLTLEQIKEVQKLMTRHYEDPVPWYMDGHEIDNKDQVICAFGADDGEGGKIFTFQRDDDKTFREVKTYALSKGIPEEQMDFLEK